MSKTHSLAAAWWGAVVTALLPGGIFESPRWGVSTSTDIRHYAGSIRKRALSGLLKQAESARLPYRVEVHPVEGEDRIEVRFSVKLNRNLKRSLRLHQGADGVLRPVRKDQTLAAGFGLEPARSVKG